jgi:glutathione S-transferase
VYTLVVGNKNYSSWSVRAWLAARMSGISFREVVIPLFEPGSKEQILSYSPAGKVPVLLDGEFAVWDSLAIIEFLADRYPENGFWPAEREQRARARSLAAEMHSGFVALRSEMPMNIRRAEKAVELSEQALADIRRVEDIWGACLTAHAEEGPFLFGAPGAVDILYAPVASRFKTYQVAVNDTTRAYMDLVLSLPAWEEVAWAAREETWVIDAFERD